ncbi:uncharacterized protein LOC113381015 [Ctenocephalides felis]|uniref:uncharacterized protein LOC113381015 n=1 Tax=Ctenocephalides felis TaxID=7515 RepID=UPI000E6E333A|nr:uncharacterized protein LOC113381015 [Ctenocephalides felis]
MAKILQTCKLIIWDKCTITHKRSLKALDRTLKDLRDNQNIFGGAMILLSGDFRQTLPVIPQSSVAEELNASLKSSNLWRHVKKLQLTTNMRVVLQQDETAKVFSKQLLNIGNAGAYAKDSDNTSEEEALRKSCRLKKPKILDLNVEDNFSHEALIEFDSPRCYTSGLAPLCDTPSNVGDNLSPLLMIPQSHQFHNLIKLSLINGGGHNINIKFDYLIKEIASMNVKLEQFTENANKTSAQILDNNNMFKALFPLNTQE